MTQAAGSEARPTLPAYLRALVAAGAAAILLWCCWVSLRVGASRMVLDYAVRAGVPAAAYSASQLTPEDPEAHYALAGLLADGGDAAGAARAYERGAALRPRDYVIWVELGKAREATGDTEGALAAFAEGVRLAPHYAQPRWQLGNALLRAGRAEESLGELRRAAESDPSLYPNFVQAVWHALGRDPRQLVEAAPPRSPEDALALLRFLVKSGAGGEAPRVLRETGHELPEDARRTLVSELLRAGRFGEAFEVWAAGGDAPRGGRGALVDGGFEETAVRGAAGFGWLLPQDDGALQLSLDAERPRDGARSLRVEYAGASNPATPALSQLFLVEPGARYQLSFSARTLELVTGGPPLVRVVSAGDGRELAATPTFPGGTNDWRDYSVEFVAHASGAVRLSLVRQACATSPCPAFGAIWLDRFELKRLSK